MNWDEFVQGLIAKGWNDQDFAALAGKSGQEFTDVVNFINGLKAGGGGVSADTLMRQRFPQMAWAIDNPELGPMLRNAVAQGWDAARLQGELLKTNWYRTTTEAERLWDRRTAEDPAEAQRLFYESIGRVDRMAKQLGVGLSQDDIYRLGIAAGRSGWDENLLTQRIMEKATFAGDRGATGQINALIDRVKQTANDYFAPVADQQAFDLAKQMIGGTMDQASMQAYFKDLAINRFQNNSQITSMLDKGFTAAQIFAPYIQQTAQLLDIAPSAVDLTNQRFSQILDHNDGTSTRPMTLTEAGQFVRGMDDYKRTQGAVSQAADFAEFIGQKMGRVA